MVKSGLSWKRRISLKMLAFGQYLLRKESTTFGFCIRTWIIGNSNNIIRKSRIVSEMYQTSFIIFEKIVLMSSSVFSNLHENISYYLRNNIVYINNEIVKISLVGVLLELFQKFCKNSSEINRGSLF